MQSNIYREFEFKYQVSLQVSMNRASRGTLCDSRGTINTKSSFTLVNYILFFIGSIHRLYLIFKVRIKNIETFVNTANCNLKKFGKEIIIEL